MRAHAAAPFRVLAVICLAAAGWAFTFGVASQAATLTLTGAGLDDTVIGLNTGTYYLGIALAAPLVPWLMRRYGIGCAGAGMVVSAAAVALFPWSSSVTGWFVLRLLQGAGGALGLIPLETYISQSARPEQRSRSFGCYAVTLTLGGAAGIAAGLHLYAPGSALPFLLAGATSLLAALGVFAAVPARPADGAESGAATPVSPARNFLSYGTAWGQGFLEGGMLAFLSLYLLALGLSQDAAGETFGAAMAGVILFQVPMAWLADRLGVTVVLLACYAVVLASLAVLPLCGAGVGLGVWLFLFGGCCGAFYPLGLALLGQRCPSDNLAGAYACYMTMECVGSITGPVCMGQARTWFGERAMFVAGGGALVLVLACWTVLRLFASRRYNAQDRGEDRAEEASAA